MAVKVDCSRCYSHLDRGIVFEKNEAKAGLLGRQRPTWAVYEADSEYAISQGVGADLPVNFLDLDPYGQPWGTLEAFFSSDREFPDSIAVVVNDGLRQKLGSKMVGNQDAPSCCG